MRTNSFSCSFGEKYKFLQNQQGLYCAYCGKTMLSEIDIKKINKSLEGKKGKKAAEILAPYVKLYKDKDANSIKQLLELACNERFQDCSFKNLAMHLTQKDVYTTDSVQTLKNLLRPICFSVEHTVPKSLGGKNTSTSYIPMHISCNSERSSESYAQIMISNPDFLENIKHSLNQIKSRMISDRLGTTHYGMNLPDDYIDKVIESIESQGIKINLIS